MYSFLCKFQLKNLAEKWKSSFDMTYQTLGVLPWYRFGNWNFFSIAWFDIFLLNCWFDKTAVAGVVRCETFNRLSNVLRVICKIIWNKVRQYCINIQLGFYSNWIRYSVILSFFSNATQSDVCDKKKRDSETAQVESNV